MQYLIKKQNIINKNWINKDKTMRTIEKKNKKNKTNHSQANFPSKDDSAIPNAWIAESG